MRRIGFSFAFALLFGCNSGEPLDVGDEARGLGQAIEDYAASWDGYAQAMKFAGDETDRVRIQLDENGDGWLRLGEEELFSAPTDPDEFYPPTYSGGPNPRVGFRSGFSFPFQGAQVESSRLRFEVDSSVMVESWCSLQPPFRAPGFWCAGVPPFYAESRVDGCVYAHEGSFVPILCQVLYGCSHFCTCDEEGCGARYDEYGIARFDAALSSDGQTLSGTLLLGNERVNVVLTRVASPGE